MFRRSRAPRSMPARSTSPAPCGSRSRPPPKARCWRRSRACSTMRCRRARAICGSPTAPRGFMRRWCTPPRLLTVLGWVLVGASWHDAIVTGVAVLIITCPCALGLAIPTVQTVASGAMFSSGVLLNAGDAIERLAEADRVIFDKTGTLTLARARGRERGRDSGRHLRARGPAGALQPSSGRCGRGRGVGESEIAAGRCHRGAGPGRARPPSAMSSSGSAGRPSAAPSHWPRQTRNLDPEASVVAFSRGDDKYLFSVRQALRPDARAIMSALDRRGIAVEILSGDREPAVAAAARALGVEEWRAGVTPAEKIARIEELKRRGAQGDDGRRRHERCAVARGCPCLDVADLAPRISARPPPISSFSAGRSRRCWRRSTMRARRCI